MSTIFKSTRKEAKNNGDLYYFTGIACKHGHISRRFVSCSVCVDCANEFRKADPDKELKRIYEYNKNNPDKMKIRQLRYRATNQGRSVANASSAKRRCIKLHATPKWLQSHDFRIIDNMYKIAAKISKETGIKHHVDHKIPLQGDLVSGLHVPDNLQIITQFENCSKGNNYDYI